MPKPSGKARSAPSSKSSKKGPAAKAQPKARPQPKAPPKVAVKPAAKTTAKPVSAVKGKGGPTAKPTASPKVAGKGAASSASSEMIEAPPVILTDEPSRILSLQFVRDGDEFLARLETATGHITELKNRSLDQLLTMVAGELEDLLG